MARRRRGSHRMTPKRRAALKKAQTASARKRKGMSRGKKVAIGLGVATVAAFAGHKASGSSLSIKRADNVSFMSGKHLGNGVRQTQFGHKSSVIIGHGSRKTTISYRLGRERKVAVAGSTVSSRSPIDKDTIPLYQQNAKKSWPYTGKKDAMKQNRKLRERGMIG